ncbi:Methionine import ATP-binding protein MetN 2 [Sporomusa silvacetica DSM 10669]|uniref:Methionine import ATP-binding protein MetN 2 n=1 Tax=Sporomusa silvacetica DSM 10669 TaxID=1123289 RepID=A0ABZ3IH40_9FIRM|nr:ATP-binding cassette domain-containing protein [Sporomusa silvacetica]OZC14838.1 methionine import ATP-binding protein MetN 2 [Sporomusa silvacetica DSM 10669]
MIVMKNISKIYSRGDKKVEALRSANLTVNQGEIFGIVGYSGAGKSTLLRCINMLERPTTGIVKIRDMEMTSLNDTQLQQARRKIGMIFQHFNLLSSSTVFMNVAAPLRLTNTPKKEIEKKVSELLNLVGLSEQASAYPSQLSGGQKQRVGIARSLANEPEILLCDEATSALDPETTDSILELLMAINRQLNLTIVLVTHEMNVIKKICDRVAVMEKGLIIEQGHVIDLFTRPQTPTAKKFISTIIDTQLPDKILEIVKNQSIPGLLARVGFVGDVGAAPLLANLSSQFHIQPNILYGNIIEVKNTICGSLIVNFIGQHDKILKVIRHLEKYGLQAEILLDVKQSEVITEKSFVERISV